MMDACVFCRVSLKNGEEITQLREKGCNTVNRTSQTRNDTIVTTPGQVTNIKKVGSQGDLETVKI